MLKGAMFFQGARASVGPGKSENFDRSARRRIGRDLRSVYGSLLWRYRDMFDRDVSAKAGSSAYVIIRDFTCRLFGYYGTINVDNAFCLDHMFGF